MSVRDDAVSTIRIESANDENAGYNARTAVAYWILAALVVGGIAIFNTGPLILDSSSRDFNPIVLIPVITSMIGAFYFAMAGRDWLRIAWFGTSVLEIDEVVAGQRLHGILRTVRDLNSTSDFVLRLQCIQSKEIAVMSGRSNLVKHTVVDDVRCDLTQKMNGKGIRSSIGIPVDFTLPGDMPPTHGPQNLAGSVRWALIATAPLAGFLNFNAVFRIPVRSHAGTAKRQLRPPAS